MAGEEPDAGSDAWKKIFNLLPPGSELKEVMLPRYTETNQLDSVLKAQVMTLVNETQIEGKTVAVEFFNPDQSTRGRIDLETATIDKTRGMLTTRNPVQIRFDQMEATGTGLYYQLETSKGALLGPATATITHRTPATAMNSPQSPFRAMAVVGMSLFTQSLLAKPPVPMTEAELAAIHADAASRAPVARERTADSQAGLEKNLADSDAASKAAAAFLASTDLPPVSDDEPVPPAEPLDVSDDIKRSVISCDGPIYFDPDERLLVFLKNVVVKDPRFDLTGANEAKAFFEEKPAESKKEKSDKPVTGPKKGKDEKPDSSKKDTGAADGKPAKKSSDSSMPGFGGDVGANIGEVERIVATGTIKIVQKATDGKEAIEASGGTFTYNVKTGEVTISGRYPWGRQGGRYVRSLKENNLIRISNGQMDTPGGGWEAGIPVPEKKTKNN